MTSFKRPMASLLWRGVLFGVALTVAACWIPEKFETAVNVKSDGSYTFTYDGTLTYYLALEAAARGALSEKDDAAMGKQAAELRKIPEFKKVDYLGKGRFKVYVEKDGKPREKYDFLDDQLKLFSVTPKADGSLEITAEKFDSETLDQLKQAGAKVEGTLTVTLESGVEVIRHNAQSEPMLFGLMGGYEWKIDSFDEDPFIVVRP